MGKRPLLARSDQGSIFVLTKYTLLASGKTIAFDGGKFDVTADFAAIIDAMPIDQSAKDAVLANLGIMRRRDLTRCPSCGEELPKPTPGTNVMQPFIDHMTTKHGMKAKPTKDEPTDEVKPTG